MGESKQEEKKGERTKERERGGGVDGRKKTEK